MYTVPYSQTVEPLGKVNIHILPDGRKRVTAYLQAENIQSGAQTGIAIEGSTLMRSAYGFKGQLGPLFVSQTGPNLVSIVTQKLGSYLARKVDADRSTTVIYWACDSDESEIELIGDLTAFEVEQTKFLGPAKFGSGINLLPAVRYFVERFADADWGMYAFLTQGAIDDLEAVKRYTNDFAEAISVGKRNRIKFVLIGVGTQINSRTLEQLDNLNTGTSEDLWDYRIAAEMKSVLELFTEVVDSSVIVSPSGGVFDSDGNIIRDFSDKGVPALMTLELPPSAKSFAVELQGKRITQPIP